MTHLRLAVLSLLLWSVLVDHASAGAREIAELPAEREVLYGRDIAPILNKNCVACHNTSNDEGGVNLESVDQMRLSDTADVLVSGDPDASRLYVLASWADEPVMPPMDNDVAATAMTPLELALLRRWIQRGAKVDREPSDPSPRTWQPLPPDLSTIYGAAMTPDGRLSAVSFGNRIRLYGARSVDPIESLEIVVDGRAAPPHDDFVQDLSIDRSGRRVISAGFRNVKLWEQNPLESVSIPPIDLGSVVAVTMNPSGDHIATLSPRGELSVAEVGQDRWKWMKSFDVPDSFQSSDPPKVEVAIDKTGDAVAIGWNDQIRIVRIDGKTEEKIDCPHDVTSILWSDSGQLVTGDSGGQVTFWSGREDHRSESQQTVFENPVVSLCATTSTPWRLFAIDSSGRFATSDPGSQTFAPLTTLPPVAALKPRDNGTWIVTDTGALGQFDFEDNKYVEIAKTDPVAEQQFAAGRWECLVGERLVTTKADEVKQAEANVTAEKKNLEDLSKDIESKSKLRDEKQMLVAKARKTADLAATKRSELKQAEAQTNQTRKELSESIRKLSDSISELEGRLSELKQQKTDTEKRLGEIPDAETLAESAKSASDEFEKAEKKAVEGTKELVAVETALRQAEESKSRGEVRLRALSAEAQRLQEAVEQEKKNQAGRKTQESASQSARDQSQAADPNWPLVGLGNRILTRSTSASGWNVWSDSGDWMAALPKLPADGELLEAGHRGILIKQTDGQVRALVASPRVWRLSRTIGAVTGASPFADRVLTVDVDPTGTLLATGGGQPSRSGELMIWNTDDGKLIRRFETPHRDTVLCVRFSPDGKSLATGSADRMIKIWDVESGKRINTLEGHTHHVTSVAWNASGRQLASGSADATCKIWDVGTGKANRTISGLKSEVTRLLYIGHEDRVGIVSSDGYFRVYRTENGTRETEAKLSGGYLDALEANRDGSRFIIGGTEGTAFIVDKQGKILQQYESSL
jgi:WD40 repeat protein